MLDQYVGEVKIGPGTLENIVLEGMKKRGMLPENASSVSFPHFFFKNRFKKQTEVFPNAVTVTFTSIVSPESPESPDHEES